MRAKRYLGILILLILAVGLSGCLVQPKQAAPQPKGSVTGTVTRESGAKVVGAVVSLGSLNATTNADGVYRITGVPYGEYTLVVRVDGTVVYAAEVVVDQDEHIVDVEIPDEIHEASVTGVVLEVKGLPISGAEVLLAGQTVTTDAQGEFGFSAIGYGEYDLVVNLMGVEVYREALEIDEENIDLEIELDNVAIGWDDATVQLGTLPDGWYVARGTPEVHQEPTSGRKALRIRPRYTAPDWDGAFLMYPETTNKVILEFSAYTPGTTRTLAVSLSYQADPTAGPTSKYGASFTVHKEGQLSYYANDTWNYFDTYIDTTKWNNYRIEVDIPTATFKVYLNGVYVGEAVFRNVISSMNQVEFSTFEQSTSAPIQWVDNVRVIVIE